VEPEYFEPAIDIFDNGEDSSHVRGLKYIVNVDHMSQNEIRSGLDESDDLVRKYAAIAGI